MLEYKVINLALGDTAMSKTTLEMALSFEGLPERQVQSCGLDEPDLGTLKGLQFRAHQIKRLGKLFRALLTLFNYEDLAWYSSQPSKAFCH